MSDLNIRNNLHMGIEFDAQGDTLRTTTSGFSGWLTVSVARVG